MIDERTRKTLELLNKLEILPNIFREMDFVSGNDKKELYTKLSNIAKVTDHFRRAKRRINTVYGGVNSIDLWISIIPGTKRKNKLVVRYNKEEMSFEFVYRGTYSKDISTTFSKPVGMCRSDFVDLVTLCYIYCLYKHNYHDLITVMMKYEMGIK